MIKTCSVVEHENVQLLGMKKFNLGACSHFWASYDHQCSAINCPAEEIDYLHMCAHVVLNSIHNRGIEKNCIALSGILSFINSII